MAKKTTKKKTEEGKEVVKWGDERVHEALENRQPLPDNIRIESPYGRSQIDVGTMGVVGAGPAGDDVTGAATGDDGNTGSSAASATRGGARD